MVDILRAWATDPEFPKAYAMFKVKPHLADAADEIEKLRAENKRLLSANRELVEEGEKLYDENKRLQTNKYVCPLAHLQKDADNFFKELPF